MARAATARVQPPPAPRPRRTVENIDIARIFEEIADLLGDPGRESVPQSVPTARRRGQLKRSQCPPHRSRPRGPARRAARHRRRPGRQDLHDPGDGHAAAPAGARRRRRQRASCRCSRFLAWDPKRAKQIYDTLGITTLGGSRDRRERPDDCASCPASRTRSNTRFCRAWPTCADTVGDGDLPTPMRTSSRSSRI